jgi:magnesium transporter
MFTLSVILGSAVLYRDFEKESGEDAGKFIGGCALTFFGVWLITSGRKTDEPDEEEFLDDEEEAIGLVHGARRYYDVEPEPRPKPRRSSTVPGSTEEEPFLRNSRPTSRHQETEGPSEPSQNLEADLALLPAIARTGTDQSVSFADDEPFVPASFSEASPLTETPWTAPEEHTVKERRSIQRLLRPLSKLFPAQDSRHLPSTLKTTHSEPLLPTEAQYDPSRPQTPPNPTSQDTNHLATPQTPDGTLRPIRHHSIVDLIPGPYTSTLSSPLSAIVADSLRRGIDVSSLKPRRRRKLPGMPQRNGLRERGNSETDLQPTPPTNSSSSSLPSGTSEQNQTSNGARSRVRSLSNTFGDLFRTMKRQRRGSKPDAEPSGSSEPSTPAADEARSTR